MTVYLDSSYRFKNMDMVDAKLAHMHVLMCYSKNYFCSIEVKFDERSQKFKIVYMKHLNADEYAEHIRSGDKEQYFDGADLFLNRLKLFFFDYNQGHYNYANENVIFYAAQWQYKQLTQQGKMSLQQSTKVLADSNMEICVHLKLRPDGRFDVADIISRKSRHETQDDSHSMFMPAEKFSLLLGS